VDPESPPPQYNGISHNVLSDNLLDIDLQAVSGDNVVTRNRCTTSSPPDLCR
jgi:hypothetical protein